MTGGPKQAVFKRTGSQHVLKHFRVCSATPAVWPGRQGVTSPFLQRAGQAQRGKVVARGARNDSHWENPEPSSRNPPGRLLASLGPVCCRGGSGRCNSFRGTGKFRMRCYLQHFNDCDSVSLPWRSSDVARTLPTQLCSPKWGANHLDSQFRLLNF